MKKKTNEKKLSLNKMKISKITNLQSVKGGEDVKGRVTTCAFPENGSKKGDETIQM